MGNNTQAAAPGTGLHPQDGGRGGTDFGPRDYTRDRENPDLLVPLATHKGTMPNLTFSYSDVHTRLEDGSWSREVTVRELPVATTLAAVYMRLNGGPRKLGYGSCTGTKRLSGA